MSRAALALLAASGCATLLLAGLPSPLLAADTADPIVHIGLVRTCGGAQRIDVHTEGKLVVRQSGSNRVIETIPDGRVTLELQSGAITLSAANLPTVSAPSVDLASEGGSLLEVIPGKSTRGKHYRGSITVRTSPGSLVTIDNVGVEEYLYSVLPQEIGSSAPAEALKAQAIAARTYALKNRGRFRDQGFDIDDTTRSQGYGGTDDETAVVTSAVDATRGIVLTYQGQLIDAPYSTDSGGVTACDPTGRCPYLQPVVDTPGPGLPEYGADKPGHEWTLQLTSQQLADALNRDARTRVANFQCLTIDGIDQSGRILSATVSDIDGTMKTISGSVLRQILGNDQLRSTRLTLTVMASGDYLFRGKGWGHGLGMSQRGAIAMASSPYNYTYRDILAHYYVGTTCQTATPALLGPLPEVAASQLRLMK